MKRVSTKDNLKKELRRLFRSMDFISNNFLSEEGVSRNKKDFQIYFNIY